jgi:AraC family transcriptional regulator
MVKGKKTAKAVVGQGRQVILHSDYIMSINQAINYIYQNLDKSLTVEEIAAHCCFSKYYFNRVFKLIVGENLYSFIKRIKLESAAFKLRASQNTAITDIAVEAGYSPSNFASAFKQYFGVSASEFRKRHEVPAKDSFAAVTEHILSLKKKDNVFAEINAKMHLKRIEGMDLVYRRVIGNYQSLKPAWHAFCVEMEKEGLIDTAPRFIGISYDDPMIADEDKCIYDICLAVEGKSNANMLHIEEGLYACYEFHDRLDKLMLVFNEIISLWLPFCCYKLDNRLSLEIYRTGIDETGNIALDICIPIQATK